MLKNKTAPPILTHHLIRRVGNSKNSDGFSLIELIIVVLIIGIFSAVAVPSWNAFISRQRTRTVNGSVWQALKTAQAEAKRQKEEVTVQFNYDPDADIDPPTVTIDGVTETLDGGGEIEAGQIKLVTNAAASTPADAITFDSLGATEQSDFQVTVSLPNDGMKRCVIVQTTLGAMRTAEGDDCP